MKYLNLTSILEFENPQIWDKIKNDECLSISPLINTGTQIRCEIGALSYVLAMFCLNLELGDDLDELDLGYLSGESNVGEEEIEENTDFVASADIIIVDKDLIKFDKNKRNLEIFITRLAQKSGAKIIDLNGDELNFENGEISELEELEIFDGAVIFTHTKNQNFSGGKYFGIVTKLRDGDNAKIKTKSLEKTAKFHLDENIKGTIAFLGVDEIRGYKFELARVLRVD